MTKSSFVLRALSVFSFIGAVAVSTPVTSASTLSLQATKDAQGKISLTGLRPPNGSTGSDPCGTAGNCVR